MISRMKSFTKILQLARQSLEKPYPFCVKLWTSLVLPIILQSAQLLRTWEETILLKMKSWQFQVSKSKQIPKLDIFK